MSSARGSHTRCHVAVPSDAWVRPSRVQQPSRTAIYHVTSRGNLRAPIYLAERGQSIASSGSSSEHAFATGLICHAYCLMGNHYHLLVETPRANLGEAMHRINRGISPSSSTWRTSVEGHLFERRYRSWVMRGQASDNWRPFDTSFAIRFGRAVLRPPRSGHGRAMQRRPACAPRPPFLTVDTVHSWFGAHGPRRHELPGVRRRRASTSLTSVRRSSKLIGEALSMRSRRRTSDHGYPLREIAAVVGLSASDTQQAATR